MGIQPADRSSSLLAVIHLTNNNMRVSELIEKLKQLPGDLEVLAYNHIQEADMMVMDARLKTLDSHGIEGVYHTGDSCTYNSNRFEEGQEVVVLFDYC